MTVLYADESNNCLTNYLLTDTWTHTQIHKHLCDSLCSGTAELNKNICIVSGENMGILRVWCRVLEAGG